MNDFVPAGQAAQAAIDKLTNARRYECTCGYLSATFSADEPRAPHTRCPNCDGIAVRVIVRRPSP